MFAAANTINAATTTIIATAAYLDDDVVIINDINTDAETTLLHYSDIDTAVAPGAVLIVCYTTEYVEDWETGEMVPQHTLVSYSTAL